MPVVESGSSEPFCGSDGDLFVVTDLHERGEEASDGAEGVCEVCYEVIQQLMVVGVVRSQLVQCRRIVNLSIICNLVQNFEVIRDRTTHCDPHGTRVGGTGVNPDDSLVVDGVVQI